jgi:DNA-binding NarL/FixJ family response regulator
MSATPQDAGPSSTDRAPLRLIIIDDHEVVLEGLKGALGHDERFDIVGVAYSGADARALARRALPDVAILDMYLPDMSGEDACRQLRELLPSLKVIVLSSYLNEAVVRAAVNAGAWAYVTKAAGLPELRATLDRVWDQSTQAAAPENVPGIVRYLEGLVEERAEDRTPTPQQARVLELLAEGLTYRRIAERLMISESTVRFHIQKLKVKFGTTSKTEMIVQCIQMGIISFPHDEASAG